MSPEFVTIVRDGLRVEESRSAEARRQVLSQQEIKSIITAAKTVDAAGDWDGDLYRLVVLLAATGARFSQISRMTVADVQASKSRLLIPVSRKGRGIKRLEHIALPVGPDVIDALTPAIEGRAGHLPLLERWKKAQIGPTEWRRDRREAWRSPSELNRPWSSILKAA